MTSYAQLIRKTPTWARVSLAVAAAALVALGLSTFITDDADFSISADTEVLSVEPACGQLLVWDLPPGQIDIVRWDVEKQDPKPSQAVSVSLRGGARARVRIDGRGRWLIDIGRSGSFGCSVPVDDVIAFSDGRSVRAAGDNDVHYVSSGQVEPGAGPVLLLRGRVVVGQEIAFGGGSASGVDAPLLARARIEARTPDAQTGQRRLIHEETVDPGAMIDTHACLDAPREPSAAESSCAARARTKSEGFFRAAKRDDAPTLEVQLAVTGRQVGVRQQGGIERRVLITEWSRLLSSTFVQLLAATLIGLSGLVQLWGGLKRDDK